MKTNFRSNDPKAIKEVIQMPINLLMAVDHKTLADSLNLGAAIPQDRILGTTTETMETINTITVTSTEMV